MDGGSLAAGDEMAMIKCDNCVGFIDTDEDPDCFVEVPELNLAERVWCESCRELEQAIS